MSKVLLNRKSQAGMGMLEVLVALLVVSLGVLAIAGVQVSGIRVAKGSYSRSLAVLYAETMIDQMRANPDGIANLDYAGMDSDAIDCSVLPATYCFAYPGESNPPRCNTAASKSINDFFSVACGQWTGSAAENGVKSELPEGRMQVACDDGGACNAESSYTITVTWNEVENLDDVEVVSNKTVSMRVIP